VKKETAIEKAQRLYDEAKEAYDNIHSPFLFKKWQDSKKALNRVLTQEQNKIKSVNPQPTLL